MADETVEEMTCAILDFLTFGPMGGSGVQEISLQCGRIEQQWGARREHEAALRERLQAALDECESRSDVLAAPEILAKYGQLRRLEIKHELVALHRSLVALQRCSDTAQLPSLVAAIVESAPGVLPAQSHLFNLLLETTSLYGDKILQSFQSDFEDHLRESGDATHSQRMWCSFLSDAKGPIVAFVLMSILPVALSSTGSVVEAYEDSLDRALAPMWSRLHFHLTIAREEESLRQLMWSFQYAKNFVDTLAVLATEVITDSLVAKILAGSGYVLDVSFILRKASRFMRAHVAAYVELLSPLPRETVLQAMESALEFDCLLRQRGLDSPFVSEVLCDFKPAFAIWVAADQRYMHDRLKAVCPPGRDASAAYGPRFRTAFLSAVKVPGIHTTEINCFACVYETCWLLLHVCRQRYSFLPLQCEDVIVDKIIEPLLCAGLGLLLYRIRSQPVLIALSKKKLPRGVVTDVEEAVGVPVAEILESARYFLEALKSVSSDDLLPSLQCDRSRLGHKWKVMRGHLSAAAMLSRGSELVINTAADVVSIAFSEDKVKTRSESGASKGQAAKESVASIDLQKKNENRGKIIDLLQFTEEQIRLICQGLVEEYQDVAILHNFRNRAIEVPGFDNKK